jgi:hypothetical protein
VSASRQIANGAAACLATRSARTRTTTCFKVNPYQLRTLIADIAAILQARNEQARSVCCYPHLDQTSTLQMHTQCIIYQPIETATSWKFRPLRRTQSTPSHLLSDTPLSSPRPAQVTELTPQSTARNSDSVLLARALDRSSVVVSSKLALCTQQEQCRWSLQSTCTVCYR